MCSGSGKYVVKLHVHTQSQVILCKDWDYNNIPSVHAQEVGWLEQLCSAKPRQLKSSQSLREAYQYRIGQIQSLRQACDYMINQVFSVRQASVYRIK